MFWFRSSRGKTNAAGRGFRMRPSRSAAPFFCDILFKVGFLFRLGRGRLLATGPARARLIMASTQGRRIYKRPEWQRTRRAVLQKDNYRCRECGRAGRMEVHHIRRIVDGGAPFDPVNLRTLCRGCHFASHRKDTRPRRPIPPDRQEWINLMGANK